jgi:hypothetical protein
MEHIMKTVEIHRKDWPVLWGWLVEAFNWTAENIGSRVSPFYTPRIRAGSRNDMHGLFQRALWRIEEHVTTSADVDWNEQGWPGFKAELHAMKKLAKKWKAPKSRSHA